MVPQPVAIENVRAQVEALRRKLLDLTMRNRMLNYRPSKRLGVTILGEDSAQLYQLLVEEGKKMTFVGRPDPPKITLEQPKLTEWSDHGDEVSLARHRQAAEDELSSFLGNPVLPVSHGDTKLNSEDLESVLQAKLRTIHREATIANEELGINTLFLTLGCLEWSDTDQRTFRAPLIYIPVRLEKQSNGAMRLSHDGSDAGTNLPLRAKLAELNLALPNLNEEKSLLDYFAEVESTVRLRGNWNVLRDEVCLGFFNYEKYAMYVDLGGDSWPEWLKPWTNPDLVSLLGGGYPTAESPIGEQTQLDSARPLKRSFEVYDADSSQVLAMIRAADGLSIVVEGPPGTGKSQTITNIISEAVAYGKTVLFVSAKRAALDVVMRRLDEAELGAMCLDLHDKLTNRREFYQEIKRTVDRTLSLRNEEERLKRLTDLRDQLNAHSSAINEPLLPFDITPFAAMAALGKLADEKPEDRDGRIPFDLIKHWPHTDICSLLPLVETLQERIREIGVPASHPFWRSEIDYLDPAKKLDLSEDLAAGISTLESSIGPLTEAASALMIDVPATAESVSVLRLVADTAIAAPAHSGLAIMAVDWHQEEKAVSDVLKSVREWNRIRVQRAPQVKQAIWELDCGAISDAFDHFAGKWFKPIVGSFRQAERALEPFLTPSASRDAVEKQRLVHDVQLVQSLTLQVSGVDAKMRSLFGSHWNGIESNPDTLQQLLDWILGLQAKVSSGQLPAGILDLLSGEIHGEELLAKVAHAESVVNSALSAYNQVGQHLEFPCAHSRSEKLTDLQQRLVVWHSELSKLPAFIAFNQARHQALNKKLDPVVSVGDIWGLARDRLLTSFLRSYYSGVVREAMQQRPELKTFERNKQEAAIREFQSLDDFKLKYNRAAVRISHYRRLPSFDLKVGNLNLLRIQCELQRSHKPIRWIMERAGEAIQKIKPVFMMSPLSVAVHLPPELPSFDMVIFDEASQVKPEDALCSIIRAKQTIVVGDTRQMPPTSFFDRLVDDENVDEDEEFSELGNEARKLESVLSLMSAVSVGNVRRPDLRWHYRSLHPALIQPSNEMFYGNRLVVFPTASTEQDGRKTGLVFHYHPETVYEPGATKRVNRLEAELVADAVVQHISNSPKESLLVAAMNKPQADLIYDEVQRRERDEPAAFEKFRSMHPHEPLSIKNLENVQGDERDVVFISVTYGRDSNGVIRQQFGPLQKDGGERRLNVLISRARRRCEVFSNLSADDLRNDPPRAGVDALKRYLKFAQTGQVEIAVPSGREEESPFEEEVAAALRERGYTFDLQVGFEGFRIDLAVIDPTHPGSYSLGIECDGATYHSARSARDRDKLRQRVLENRGWRLHRIWSFDWWQNRETEIQRLIEAIEATTHVEEAEVPEDHDVILVEEPKLGGDLGRFTRPYVTTPEPALLTTKGELAQYMLQVVQVEGPIHEDLVRLRLREAGGFERTTKIVKALLDESIREASKNVRHVVDSYYYDDSQFRQPRDWSGRPPTERKVEFVPEVEIAAALRHVVGNAFGIDEASAAKSALNLLGFKRVSDTGLVRGLAVVQRMITAGGLHLSDGLLYRQEIQGHPRQH